MRRFWTVPIAGLMLLGLTACPGFTQMHTARPIEPGSLEIGLHAVAAGFPTLDLLTAEETMAIGPGIEFQMRYGINDMSDFGIKYSTLQPLSLTLDYNFAFLNTGSFALAVDPTISPGYLSGGGGSMFWSWVFLPVIAHVVSTESMVLSVTVRPGFLYGSISGTLDADWQADGFMFTVGGGVGVKFMLGESFALMPEFMAQYMFDGGNLYWTGGLGFLF